MDTNLAADIRRHVDARLLYLRDSSERPVSYTFEPPPGVPWRSGQNIEVSVPVHDGRPLEGRLSLDREGFAFVHHPSAVTDFRDAAKIKSAYFEESARLVRSITGASKVVTFDYNLRHAAAPGRDSTGVSQPVRRVHNDFTAESGPRRARAELLAAGENADRLLKHRFAIINVWRPIRGPVQNSPLAVCDARTVDPQDLVVSDLVYRDRVGHTYAVAYSPRHRWFYFPEMRVDEAILIKSLDSEAGGGTARFAPHTAFDDPTSPPGAAPRESIEVRTLALFAPEA
ncbi:MAG: CmcJ/NvfI family oxidoreductase [Alphaproteobacteria bacterium]